MRQILILLLSLIPFTALAQTEGTEEDASGPVVKLAPITVEAEEFERKPRNTLNNRFITSATGSGGDPLRVLNHLPSIGTLNDFVGILSVRGGGPEDNLYYFDRLPLGYPYHLHGIVSTLNTDVIENIEVYPGGYGAEFGSESQAVIDIRSRTLTEAPFGGKINANPIYSQAFVEGNIGQRGYWYAFGRRSYMGPLFEILPTLLEIENDLVTEVPSFWSYQGKVAYQLNATHTLVVNAIAAADSGTFNFTADETSDTELVGPFHTDNPFDAQGIHLYSEKPDTFRSVLSFTRSFDRTLLQYGDGYFYRTAQSTYALRGDLTHLNTALESGFHFALLPTSLISTGARPIEEGDPDYNFRLKRDGEKVHTTAADTLYRLEAYLQNTQDIAEARYVNLYTTLGVRATYFNLVDDLSLQPRGLLGMTVGSNRTQTHKNGFFPIDLQFSVGNYVQNPELYHATLGNRNPELAASLATHYVVTLKKVLTAKPNPEDTASQSLSSSQTKIQVSTYYKKLRDMITFNESETEYRNQRTGHVKGMELSVEHHIGNGFRTWLSYAYILSKRQDSPRDDERFYMYNTPHNVTLGLNYLSGSWEFGANWHYKSGVLYSPLVGRERYTNPFTKVETWLPLHGEPARTAPYHRLDLRFHLPVLQIGRWKAGFTAELWNVYNRTNYLQVRYNSDYTKEVPIAQLPLTPFLAITAEF